MYFFSFSSTSVLNYCC